MQKERTIGADLFRSAKIDFRCPRRGLGDDFRRWMMLAGLALLMGSMAAPRAHAAAAAAENGQDAVAYQAAELSEIGEELDVAATCECKADVDKDGEVTQHDIDLIQDCFAGSPDPICDNADVDCDGTINLSDIVAANCVLELPPTEPPEQCCGKTVEDVCIYTVACIDGSCSGCGILNPGLLCEGSACPGQTCSTGFSSTCGADCCLEMVWTGQCQPPSGLPACPQENNPCPCDPTEGACCNADGTCTEGPESKCTGQYQGDGSSCGGDGPCCIGGACVTMDTLCCQKQGGIPKPCTVGAACCITDDECPSEKCRPGFCDATSTCDLLPIQSGCCVSDGDCPDTKCRRGICDSATNSCSLGPKDAGCCESDGQCDAFATKCRPGLCDPLTNSCFTGQKDPGCCETNSQCPNTKCRFGFCNFSTNTCELEDKLPGCCESDGQCFGTKCRPGLCDPIGNSCFLGPPIPDCCESDADCGKCESCDQLQNACRPVTFPCCETDADCSKCEFCDQLQNACRPVTFPCCETDADCTSTKCRRGICDSATNSCSLGPKDAGCCETDLQCPDSKCRIGFCDLTTNTCDLSDKIAGCCETDSQCPGTKCRFGFCNSSTNSCELTAKIPGCCESDAQCPSTKCRTGVCDLVTNSCILTPKAPNCCETDAQCPSSKCRLGFCDLTTNLCALGPKFPGCCTSDLQCPPGSFCDLTTNQCVSLPLFPKWSQRPGDDGEDVPSNLDWPDMAPNVVVADDWVSDGRVITAVRWWGSRVKTPDPKACPGPEGAVCGDGAQDCVCVSRIDGSLNCADAASLANSVTTCQDDSQCVSPSKCFGPAGGVGFCAVNCGDAPPDPKLCPGPEGAVCGDPNLDCVCAGRIDGSLNCADSASIANATDLCQDDSQCVPPSKCFGQPGALGVCAVNCGDAPPDPKVCPGPEGAVCGDGAQDCVCVSRINGDLNCADSASLANATITCTGDAACPPPSKCFGPDGAAGVCAVNCGDVPPDPKFCDSAGDSPFCNAAWSKCGNAVDECHCGRHAPLGQGIGVEGVCLDKPQFADCAAMIACGPPPIGGGDPYCSAVLPGSKCVFDECCGHVCAFNCGETPPDPKVCPVLNDVCGDPTLQCVCSTRIDGSLNCADSKSLGDCFNTCFSDSDCAAPSKCFGDPGTAGCCAVNCGDSPPDPKVCNGKGTTCGDADSDCVCETRIDGTLNCADRNDFDSGIHGFCPNGDAECPTGTKCFTNTPVGVDPVCAHNCGDHPFGPKVCDPAGDSPFCTAEWSKCGGLADECYCGRHAPLGQTVGVGGVCLDKNQFANGCAAMISCAGDGDALCDAVNPGSKCVFDECCQWVCAHNCGEVPDPKLCPILGEDCGIPGVNCFCSERTDGTQNCADVDDLALCNFPCTSDADCDAANGIKCFVDPAGINPGCCTRNCSGFQMISMEADIETASSPTPTGRVTAVLREPTVDAGDLSVDSVQAVGDPDGWFLSFHQPLTKGTASDRPLAVYFCDVDAVQITNTTLPACDGHPVLEYFVHLDNCCLVHESGDTRYDPPLPVAFKDGFHEQQCDDYHLDIQAVVGTKFFQDPATLECIESKTGRTADADYWGWHTSPRICGKDPFGPNTALTGQVIMGPAGEWLYGPWVNTTTICSEANMAFELLTPEINTDPTKDDFNGNCIPDKCECPPVDPPSIPPAASHAAQRKNRYFSIVPNNPGQLTALRVTLTASTRFPGDVGKQWWVGPPREICENSGHGLAIPPSQCGPAPGIPKRTMWSSNLSCTQECRDWHSLVDVAGNALDVLHVGDPDIVTDSVYTIEAVDCSCDKTDKANYSAPLAWGTSRWGDISAVLPADCPRSPPEGTLSIVLDVVAVLDKFSNNSCAVLKSRADLEPHAPDRLVNISDVLFALNAFSGNPYPFPGPAGCPGCCP